MLETTTKQMKNNRRKSFRFATTRNFFLHIHSPRVHPYSLKPTYTFGLGVGAAFLFLILLFSGALLMLYYVPSVERAYASVKDIIFVVPGGRWLRNMHRWAGHGLVLIAFLHLARTFYTAAYAKGRRFNWIIGVALLIVTLFMSFSGYLLPWDQLAFWAVTIGSNIAASFRELTDALGVTAYSDIGGFMKKVLIGGESVDQQALTRFYMLHVLFLPITFLILLGIHLWRIRKDGGLNIPHNADELVGLNSNDDTAKINAWPTALWSELAVLMTILALLMIFSFAIDAPLLEPANPALPENPAKSPWYFLGIQELVSYSGFTGGILIPIGFIAFLISLPFMDMNENGVGLWFTNQRGRRTVAQSFVFSVLATVSVIIFNELFGSLLDWLPALPDVLAILINPGTILILLYVAWTAFISAKNGSKRSAALAMFTCVMGGLIILTAIALAFRGPNWDFFWPPFGWLH